MGDRKTFVGPDTRIGELGFPGWTDVSQRLSIADLFFKKSNRCGIYVLGFAEGERYVGQSINVVKRFAQHQRGHGDISSFTFRRVPREDLSRVERECIHSLEAHGIRLRNLDHMSVIQGGRDLNLIVTPDEQSQWLARQSAPEAAGRLVDDTNLRRRYRRRFEQFIQLPHAEEALFLLGTYVHAVIPFSRRTEMSFWSISCLPNNGRGGIYSRVDLNMQEVLTLGADEQGLWANFHLARSPFEEYFGEHWQETLANDGWSPQLHAYQPGGQDQFCLAGNDPDGAKALMVWPVPSNAMSKLNLNLLRRGPNFYSSSHCLDLVDAAVATFQRRKHELNAVHELMPEDERPRQRWY